MSSFHPILFALLILAFLTSAPSQAGAASVTYNGRSVAIGGSFQRPMQCILDTVKARKYHARSVGCFGSRPGNASAHPTGHACDVDQTSRNRTSLNARFSSSAQIQIARGCSGVSGCQWHRNPDCGHFEQRSAPYSRAGAPVANHLYARYASHPVTRRRRYR
jgi:hypothetical protein